jgi:carbon-monoxide dehydrogenase small subunit
MMQLVFRLNGQERSLVVDGALRAIDVLREHCGVTGPKEGCGTGECGACAIWIDGVTRLSCLTLAGQLHGRDVTTAEGLAQGGLHPVQTALAECGGIQCGYCTPGIVMTAAELLGRDSSPSRDAIRTAISGNLCRCTGYHKIVDAVEEAATAMHARREEQ